MKIRNRVFVKDKLEEGVQLKLDQKVAHYLFHVLRCKNGEYISLFNESSEWLSSIDKLSSKEAIISITENIKIAEKKREITLYFSPIIPFLIGNLPVISAALLGVQTLDAE